MHIKRSIKISKIILITTLILAVTLAIIAAFTISNPANAEDANTTPATETNTTEPEAVAKQEPVAVNEGSYTFHNLKISGSHTPVENTDYETGYDTDRQANVITIKTDGWTLSGTPGGDGDTPLITKLNCNSVALDNLEVNFTGSELEILSDCEISLVGNDDTYLPYVNFAHNVTIKGPKKLHIIEGTLVAEKNITLENTVLEIFKQTHQYSNKKPAVLMSVEGTLSAYSSRIVISNDIDNSIGLALKSNIYLDNSSELFSSGQKSAIIYDVPGTLNNICGTEEFVAEFKDRQKANQITSEEYDPADGGHYTKVIPGQNGVAKTIYSNGAPYNPQPSEPTNTAQTGDIAGLAILGFALLAIAGFAICVVSRKHNN